MERNDRFYLFLLQGNNVWSITPDVQGRFSLLVFEQAAVADVSGAPAQAVRPIPGRPPSIGAILAGRPLTGRTQAVLVVVRSLVADFDASVLRPGAATTPMGRTTLRLARIPGGRREAKQGLGLRRTEKAEDGPRN
jgi:hypothetical protein